ncbi:MAG TPA: hypothetical protein VIM94_10895 [Salegentibacter sp.]|uniref:hypothetical protein n=1 Tax=Salegentibacter sp. TaxID=1903072 RepID=UPI002F954098
MRVVLPLIILLQLSCSTVGQNKSDSINEKEIMIELLPILVEELYTDFRLSLPPPPPPSNEKDSVEIIRQWEKEYLEKVEEIKKDTSLIVIAVYDTIYELDERERQKITSHFTEVDSVPNSDYKTGYKIELNKVRSDKFRFKYRSEFPEGREIWRKDYPFLFSGIATFSRIQFDESGKFGVLTATYGCGKLCGHSATIFLRRDSVGWKIDDIIITGIS